MSILGKLVAIWRYPVKSMAAEPLDEVELSWHGLAGDRRWAFVQEDIPRSGFPWLTIRERTDMAHHVPRFADPSRPDTSRTLVTTPGGDEYDVVDAALAEALGGGVRVIKQNRGVFDAMPLSLITTQTVEHVAARVGLGLGPERFRPNLVVEAEGGEPFAEEEWIGATLRIGGAAMRLDQRDSRCVVVNVDPATLERNPAVLRTIAQERGSCLGVYGSTVRPGRVAVGDPVELAS
ncbi:MAG: uncharacterized protein QOI62_1028 [Solirubrobacteraceae bacterium]|jgi:uncharacterized protein YcbX|nr:uncharacterized protein [Solirubrobacteraceae bacterium]